MAEISLKSLFGKLNSLCFKASEAATVFCKMRGNPHVELLHFFHQVLQLQDSDLHRIVKHFELNPSKLVADLTESLDRLPRGASSISGFDAELEEAVERAWTYATLLFNEPAIRSGHVVVGILKTKGLQRSLLAISGEFEKVKIEELTDNWESILGESVEARLAASDGSSVTGGGAIPGRGVRRDGPRRDGQGGGAPAVLPRHDRGGPNRQDRPDRRTRRGDPPARGHPHAPPAEQPGARRRGRRRQDGRRRGLRASSIVEG